MKKHGEIPPDTAVGSKIDKTCENYTWLQNPVDCVSKWSKALKTGIDRSVGLDSRYAAQRNSKENDSLSF